MKVHDKFKQRLNFVRPLYRNIRNESRIRPFKKLFVSIDVTNDTKLRGNGIDVKRKIVRTDDDNEVIKRKTVESVNKILPGTCDNGDISVGGVQSSFSRKEDYVEHNKRKKIVNSKETNKMENANQILDDHKSLQAEKDLIIIHKAADTWLRVYPAPQATHESILLVVMRCVVCQLGLASFLVLWTICWVFVIHYFEEPFERDVSINFEKEQNKLVIDLATELRQITPVSPTWKYVIEKRIEDERKLTIQAVGRGAKLHPGQFWNLSGTFLFTVFVMTALGFGAPVPHTMWGRTSGLIYASLAVPTHIFLMLNASTCLVVYLEPKTRNLVSSIHDKRKKWRQHTAKNNIDSPSHSRNSELNKANGSFICDKLLCLFKLLIAGRCVPIVIILYYTLGVICFGVIRNRQPLEAIMFPLEFTTTGGLEHVEDYVRMFYGFYVEGAMALLAYALAILRRHSSDTIKLMSEKHRLFSIEK